MKTILANVYAIVILTISTPIIGLSILFYSIPNILLSPVRGDWEVWNTTSKMEKFINKIAKFFDP